MENCLFQGKTICTFDLKDGNGIYYEELVLEWKEAAANRLLTCTECGAHVYLAAGPIKEPYFAHYDTLDCDYDSGYETEELKKGKRLLYQLLKRSFPEADTQARFRMDNGLYSTLYCILEDGRSYAVDYRLTNNSLEKFRERDTFYQANRIKPIYILGKRQEKDTKQIDWYQSLIQSSMGYLAFLDTDRERITLKKSFGYRLGNTRKFLYCIKTYPIKELLLDTEGLMSQDFTGECGQLEQKIRQEKEQYARRQEQLKKLQEEQLRYQEAESKKQEAYRLSQEQNKNQSEAMKSEPDQELKNLNDLHDQLEQSGVQKQSGHPEQELNPVILEKCRKMIEEGNGHLVSRKYYDAIVHNGH